MKILRIILVGLLNILLFCLSGDESDKNNNTRQIDLFDNPNSNPHHDGDWEDVNGNVFERNIDGNHYSQSGDLWGE